ncbi:hypothetical protein CDD82_2700 [Ophiocordyceps australis]|uniref:Elongator complex protein 2 n=1 Tax=Ophiocordyceps australis TaxID=1399860 RepID=A0A2C5ZIK9_9HYPO|nr:hypothetical protein CDD82_2700 [Ophiocordyceps australis]
MSSTGVSVEYIATGANRQTAAADWSRSGVLAFGAQANVALWRPCLDPPQGIFALLSGHTETVKAVKFLPEAEDDEASYLVTGSDDKTLLVWKSSSDRRSFGILATSGEHQGAVNCIAAVRPRRDWHKYIIATGAADATIRIWALAQDQVKLVQTIETAPKYFPLSVCLAALGAEQDGLLVLAAAGTRDGIQILTGETESGLFSVKTNLSGHEGWVRSLDFATGSDSELLLASASQDKYVRIWRLHKAVSAATPPSNKAYWVAAGTRLYSVTFEALLLGHDDWIYSARWHVGRHGRGLQLLTASADNSLAIWQADASSGIWVSTVRLGEISREKGATTATGSTGGFWTGLWGPHGRSVACLGRTGSWRTWQLLDDDGWRPCVAVSGHTRPVTGIAWSATGRHVVSTSLDQTTRLHGQWAASTWHELARPQIHGYDINCIGWLGPRHLVSGADEKLMRVFAQPRAVARLLSRLAGREPVDEPLHDALDSSAALHVPDTADMPVLGLSNKAVVHQDAPTHDSTALAAKPPPLDLAHPPLEETLSRHTLWPETEKLYGHGYEISCLATSHDGALVASACKASSTNHAVIRLFETTRWTELRPPLTAHSLTATRLRFSLDDALLLSVGRDRRWAVFERAPNHSAGFCLVQTNPKGHTRMILDAAWAPPAAHFVVFATAGRDKQVHIWASPTTNLAFSQAATLPTATPVTSVDFLSRLADGKLVLAVGTEAGRLSICLVSPDGSSITELPPPPQLLFSRPVLQLAWRPCLDTCQAASYTLAVAGEDSSLRLYSIEPAYLRSV